MSTLRMSAVKAETGHRSHISIYNVIKAGIFTKPVPSGERSVGRPDYKVKVINQVRVAGQKDDQIKELVNRLHTKQTTIANGVRG